MTGRAWAWCGEVVGHYADFKLALYATLVAGQRLQSRLDEQLHEEARQQIRDYYEVKPDEPPVESDVPVVQLAQDRKALIAFLTELGPSWEG